LPDSVRTRLISLAAEALGSMSAEELPPTLRPVARFAAGQRAKRGGTAIASALESHPAFRTRVLAAADKAYPGLVEMLRAGNPPHTADLEELALVAYLLRSDGWQEVVDAANAPARDNAASARAEAAAERLREQLETVRAEARASREKYKAEVERIKEENTGLRQRLNKTRKLLEAAQQQAEDRERDHAQAVSASAEAERDLRRLRAALAAAQEERDASRRAGRDDRGLQVAKLGLLLDTVAEAASGLRRELALPPSVKRPADEVAARLPGDAAPPGHRRAKDSDDPAHLNDLLAMPKAHLVVDGYNVTKSVWGTLSLEAQRSRLVAGLRALAARTGAETTCVFDGSDVTVPPPVAQAAGVRVRFSPAGETADELIRRLVSAEPAGRVVIVVSSDREVAADAQQLGGYAVAARALAGLLE
jgi:predicted RNA-binding protein with PIN domain